MKRIKSFSAIITSFVMAFSGVVALPVSAKKDDTFTITYYINSKEYSVSSFNKKEKITSLINPMDEKYEVSCWHTKQNLSDSCVETPFELNKNLKLYGTWEARTFNIIYNLEGGINGNNPTSYTHGKGVASFAPAAKEGFDFVKWTDKNGTEVKEIGPTEYGDKTLIANWEAKKPEEKPETEPEEKPETKPEEKDEGHQIKWWNVEGSNNSEVNNFYEYFPDKDTKISTNVVKPGYRLKSWNKKPKCNGDTLAGNIIPAGSKGTFHLCAVWTEDDYGIEYRLNGGTDSGSNPETYKYGVGVESFAPATKNGYDFVNWTNENGEEVSSISKEDWGDKTLFANWFLKPVLAKNSDTIFVGEKNINFAMTMDARDEVEFYLNEELISAEDFLNSYTDKDGLVHFTVKPEFVEKLAAGEYDIVAKLASGYTLEYNLAVKELPKTVVTALTPDTGVTTKEEFSAASNLSILVTVAAVVSLLGIALRKSNY